MTGRHEEIAEGIRDRIAENLEDLSFVDEIFVEDYQENNELSNGITIMPLGEAEQIGTNERDDVDYATLVVRSSHALASEDLGNKSSFRDQIRKLFHNKRIEYAEGCFLYSRISFGQFAIPSAWTQSNKSVTAFKILTLVRESRE